jgi:hypothetical protein
MANLNTTTDTAKLKISTTVQVYDTVELNIDLPYYCKSPDAYWKIISETESVRVSGYPNPCCVMIINPTHSHNAKDIAVAVVVSEQEFNQVLETALSNIKKLAA